MQLKKGVNATGISSELLLGLMVADSVYRDMGVELVVTSLVDGAHSTTSLHYAGDAADLRTWEFSLEQAREAVTSIKEGLPDDYDVVLEKDHIHLERQPRRR